MGKVTLGTDLHDFIEFLSNKNNRSAFEYNLKGFYALFYLLILIIIKFGYNARCHWLK